MTFSSNVLQVFCFVFSAMFTQRLMRASTYQYSHFYCLFLPLRCIKVAFTFLYLF